MRKAFIILPLLLMLLVPAVSAGLLSLSGQSELRGSTVTYTGTAITLAANTTTSTQIIFYNFTAGSSFVWINNNRVTYTATINATYFVFTPGVACTYWTVTRLANGTVWFATFYVTPGNQLFTLTGFVAAWFVWIGALIYALPLAVNIGIYLYTKSIGLLVNAFIFTAAAGMYLVPILRLPSLLVVALGVVVLFYQFATRRKLS